MVLQAICAHTRGASLIVTVIYERRGVIFKSEPNVTNNAAPGMRDFCRQNPKFLA
jgi:hypothetical protein